MHASVLEPLKDVASLGPYFVINTSREGEGWRPMPETDPAELDRLIDHYAERLGTSDRRVAASILFQGLASRLWSPAVACKAAHDVLPDYGVLMWRWEPGKPIALWLPDLRPAPYSLFDMVVRGTLTPLIEAWPVKLAEGLMWGNAASALAGTRYAVTLRPSLAPKLNHLVAEQFLHAPLRDTLDPKTWQRRSCCLYYKVPPGGEKCGDCPL